MTYKVYIKRLPDYEYVTRYTYHDINQLITDLLYGDLNKYHTADYVIELRPVGSSVNHK